MDGLQDLVTDPKLRLLLQPAIWVALAMTVVGIVQGIRGGFPTLGSGALVIISDSVGIVVLGLAMLMVGVDGSPQTVGFLLLFGQAIGLGATGIVTVSTHWGTTTTRDPNSQ